MSFGEEEKLPASADSFFCEIMIQHFMEYRAYDHFLRFKSTFHAL